MVLKSDLYLDVNFLPLQRGKHILQAFAFHGNRVSSMCFVNLHNQGIRPLFQPTDEGTPIIQDSGK